MPSSIGGAFKDVWAEAIEQRSQGTAIVSLARVSMAQLPDLLRYSGKGGVFLDPLPATMKLLQPIALEWHDPEEGETLADQLARLRGKAPDAGITRGRRQLGMRSFTIQAVWPLRAYQIRDAPLWWEDCDVQEICRDQAGLKELVIQGKQRRRAGATCGYEPAAP